jgi:predicted ABC-type ATPase
MQAGGYRLEIVYLRLPSSAVALKRIASRVKQGGHDVPRVDVMRRFERSWRNFERVYRPMANFWAIYDNSGERPVLLEEGP